MEDFLDDSGQYEIHLMFDLGSRNVIFMLNSQLLDIYTAECFTKLPQGFYLEQAYKCEKIFIFIANKYWCLKLLGFFSQGLLKLIFMLCY